MIDRLLPPRWLERPAHRLVLGVMALVFSQSARPADAIPSEAPESTMVSCRMLVYTGFSGEGCCANGATTCLGYSSVIWSYSCAGTCPDEEDVCITTLTGSQAVLLYRSCTGSCPGGRTLGSPEYTFADTSVKCGCAGPAN